MRNAEGWRPSKYICKNGSLVANRRGVGPSSWFVSNIQARVYSDLIRRFAVPGNFVELGCGLVPLYEEYRDIAKVVTCVDWPSGPHDSRHVDVFADLSGPLPELPSSFASTVIVTDVMEHLPRPEVVIGEVSRMLEPGGRVLASAPFLYWLHEAPHDYQRYTEFKWRQMLEDAGLKVVHLEAYGGIVEVFLDLVAKNLKYRGLLRMHGWLADRLLSAPQFRLRRTDRFPLGYVVAAERPA